MKSCGDRYGEDFKLVILNLRLSGMKLADIDREHGIKPSTLDRLMKLYSLAKSDKEDKTVTHKEYRKLQKENLKLKEDLEILKKAMAIFSKK